MRVGAGFVGQYARFLATSKEDAEATEAILQRQAVAEAQLSQRVSLDAARLKRAIETLDLAGDFAGVAGELGGDGSSSGSASPSDVIGGGTQVGAMVVGLVEEGRTQEAADLGRCSQEALGLHAAAARERARIESDFGALIEVASSGRE